MSKPGPLPPLAVPTLSPPLRRSTPTFSACKPRESRLLVNPLLYFLRVNPSPNSRKPNASILNIK